MKNKKKRAWKEAPLSTLFTLDRVTVFSVFVAILWYYGEFQESICGGCSLFICLFVYQFVQGTVDVVTRGYILIICKCQVSVTFVFKCFEVNRMLSCNLLVFDKL